MSQASTPVCSLVENTDSIKYHGYIVVIQSHDSEWSRCRDGLGSNKAIPYSANQVFTSVKNNLTAYRKKLEDNYSDLSNHDKRGNPDNYEQSYKGYLYEPIIFQPYSHADTLSIYLVDDLDPIHGLAAEAQYLTEELFVGFCPTKASLNLGDHSIEVHEFIELFKNPVKGDLISFTKMKLDGLLTLGQGLLTQEAIFLLISDVIDIEKKSFESDLKFSLVDLQGQEEVGLLIASNDISLTSRIIDELQKASFVDVFRASEKLHDGKVLKDLVSQNNSLQTKILNRSNSIITEKGHDSGTLSQNNALRWTHTTFAKAYTERNSYSSYEGRLSASLSISITPGQRPRFIDCLDKVLSEESSDIYPKETWDLQKHVHQFGTDDLIIKTVTHDANKIIPWADEFREKILELETTLPNRIIQGITIKISHESILEGEIVNTYSVIEPCLSSLKKDTFTKEGALFNLEKLKKSLTYFGVPIPLRRSLVYLYQDYANLLSNPQLFDLVIDLYDSFLTLYKVITNEDGELNDHTHTYNRENGKELQREILLNEAVNFLSQKVEALHNSFSNRANNAYPEEAVRDLSVLFQGQLSQVLSAADAPLKCGVGVLRRNSLGGKASDYQKVGVSVKIGFAKGVAVTTMPKSLKVTGDCSRRSTLAFVQIDVPHLLHVATYCDYLHEAFHLVCNSWIESDAGIGVEKFSKLSNFNQDRYEELLVHLLTCLFIAADDPETYILYYLTQVSNNSLLLSSDSKMVAARWVEECLRFYTISWLINKGVVKNDSFLKESIFNELSGIEATKFYSEFVDGFKEFFAQKLYIHCELVNYPDENRGKLEKFAQEAALQFIVSMFSSLESIWTCCYETIGRFEADELRQDTESKDATGSTLILTKVELASRVDGELKDGKPLSCALYDPERVYSRDKVAPDIGINPMLVMCAQIYSYIKRNQTSDPECSHHLRRVRQPDDSFKNVLDPGKPPADFLQDISSPSMFCCIPSLREERLKQQIAIIKTMWDISSSIKARRLAHLLGLEDDL